VNYLKTPVFRSDKWLRAVASLPCMPTSTLTVRECSDLIEFINAWAAMAEET